MTIEMIEGDCREILRELPDASVDSVVTDPPYALVSIIKRFGKEGSAPAKGNDAYMRASKGFMGKAWDTGEVAFAESFWTEVLRVLKPGGHVIGFGGTRSHHRMWCAIENAGFEIRDSLLHLFDLDPLIVGFFKSLSAVQQQEFLYIMDQLSHGGMLAWVYGSGFPKSHNPDGEWEGWGTALKPAWEPICLARKPLIGTVAANLAAHGVGALNIDGCRVEGTVEGPGTTPRSSVEGQRGSMAGAMNRVDYDGSKGRWPANLIHDGSDEVIAAFPNAPGQLAAASSSETRKNQNVYGAMARGSDAGGVRNDSGSAARFFYCAKASKTDRGEGNTHPTVKPIALMRYLCRLITPPGGTVLDPFAGSGSTGVAADLEGFSFIGVEADAEYFDIAAKRLGLDQPLQAAE